MKIYMDVYSDFDNLGDLLIRRGLLTWFSDAGDFYLYVSSRAPESYVDSLKFSGKARIFTDKKQWVLSLAQAGKEAVLLLKPGWIRLEGKDLRSVVVEILLSGLVRLRGGKVLAIGRGVHSFTSTIVFLHRALLILTHKTWWRNKWSANVVGGGDTMPDIVFGMRNEPSTLGSNIIRRRLAISLRGDKPWPRKEWLAAIREIARQSKLDITCVVQVKLDNERMVAVAKELGCDLVGWHDEPHDAQEKDLRRIYSESVFVISDRMHALILGSVEGAIPVGLSEAGYLKAVSHFSEIGLDFICRDASHLSTAEMVEFVALLSERSTQIRSHLEEAFRRLQEVCIETRGLLNL